MEGGGGEWNSRFIMFAYNSGKEFSCESLVSNSGVRKDTLRR